MSGDIASLYIKVDSKGVVTASRDLADLEKTSAKVEGTTKKVESATASANRSFTQMAGVVKQLAAAYGVLQMAQYVKDATMLAARYETLGVVMRVVGNNAGYTSAQMEAYTKSLEKAGISMIEARQTLTRMVQANLDLAKSSQLARVAQDAAVIGNINSSEAFQRMVYGIQSGQVEILRTIGINVNFENSYQAVAKATGRVTAQLSEAEKSQIRMNAVMDAGKMIAGTYEAAMGTAGKQVLSLQRHIDNLKVAFGLAFTPALAEIIETITGAITDLNGELSGDSKDKITAWGVNFRIVLIDIQAEIRRLAMFLDKLGGTMTSAQMLLYGPGRALGVKSSTERFERAADANMEYERRYNASDKALEDLMAKRIKLEQSLTAEGKKAAKAAQDAAEKKVLAAQRAAKAAQEEVSGKVSDEQRKREADEQKKAQDLRREIYLKDEADKWEKLEEYEKDYADKQAKFQDEYKRATMSTTEYELDQLQSRYDEYATYISDKEKLDEWYKASKEKLLDKEAKKEKDQLDDLKRTIEGWGRDSTNAIVKFCRTGETSFSDMINSMIDDLLRMAIQEQIMGPLFKGISQGIGGLVVGYLEGMVPSANGNVFQNGNVTPFAHGGIVSQPTVFPMARGAGIMGESGPEAVMPLTRIGGDLGVRALAGGGTEVNIYNNVGADVSTKERTTADGSKAIDVYIDQAVAKKLGQFGSQSNRAMRQMGGRQPLTGR